ncbi:DUF2690 domain-containing protein [Streptomyces sp. NPDC006658]|uniref:DUF2690 domain-containing protein n=1 Tax=Streptomyces sp. NPDC006658 TaxID=3156900 RepID=UPI0033DA0428
MPRWTALPDDLDPQITEFTVGLRQLVDRSGLSVAALADRTGYGTTSWERYLDGRLLAPKGAVIALAEATGTQPGPLTTLWELAERAWSRSESRNDSTRQALRMAEGENDRRTTDADTGKSAGKTVGKGLGKGAGQGDGKGLGVSAGQDVGKGSGLGGAGTAVVPGSAGSGGVPPAVPAQPAAPDADTGDRAADGSASGSGATTAGRSGAGAASAGDAGTAAGGAGTPVKNSWGLAGYRGPSQASARPAGTPAATPSGPVGNPVGPSATPARPLGTSAVPPGSHANFLNIPAGTPGTPVGAPGTPAGPGATRLLGTTPGPARAPQGRPAAVEGRSGRWQPVVMFFAGLIGVLALIAGVFYFTHRDGKAGNEAKPSPSASARATPPPGVKCTGSDCTGKDAEAMGCGGDLVTTAKTATVGTTTLEVRYSKVCGTAWGRITSGVPGDSVRVSVGKERQTGDITAAGDTIGYTPMVAVRNPARARACATLASGQTGCTE